MDLLVHTAGPANLRDKIENYLKDEASTWLYIDDYKTQQGTIRPVFTHKSTNYKDKAKFVIFSQPGDQRIFFEFIEKESAEKKAQYIGMLVPLIMNNFENDFTSISIVK